jgi:hypothetical protein
VPIWACLDNVVAVGTITPVQLFLECNILSRQSVNCRSRLAHQCSSVRKDVFARKIFHVLPLASVEAYIDYTLNLIWRDLQFDKNELKSSDEKG